MSHALYSIFVDESGTLADPNDTLVVVGAIATRSPLGLEKVVRKTREKLKRKGKKYRELGEIKFSSASDATRKQILQALARRDDIEIFLLVVEKGNERLRDTPSNYVAILWPLLREVYTRHPDTMTPLDKHYNLIERREQINRELEARAGKALVVQHVDSEQDTRIQLADFVAGAGMVKYRTWDTQFWEIIAARAAFEQRVRWKEIKKW